MAIALVGQAVSASFALTCVVTRTTTAGNTLIAQVQHQGRTSVAISDSAGNTWTLAGTSNTSAATSERLVSTYYCLSANSVTSVTATEATTTALRMNVSEWTGITAFRAATNAFITSGAVTSPVSATSADLIVGVGGYFSSAGGRLDTLSATWTRMSEITDSSLTQSMFAYKIATSTASQGPTWTGIGGSVGLVTAAFYGPVVNVPPTVTPPASQRIATGSTAVLTMTATDPDGSISTASWANTSRPTGASAPTLTPSGSPSGITVTTSALTVAGTYTFTPSASDGTATTVGAVATVYVYAADKTGKVDSVSFGSSGWTGTAADVSDGSDATWASGPTAPVAPASRAIFRMKPIADGDLTITKMRLRLDPTIVGGAAETCTVEILNGPSDAVIATRTGINVTSTSFVDFAATPIALTGPENTAFTNHSVWAIAITPNQ